MSRTAVDEEESSEILRVCSYHNRGNDRLLVRSLHGERDAVATSLQTTFATAAAPAGSPLRGLFQLPPEIMAMVLRELDLLSYFRFRQVSRQMRAVATTLVREYALLAAHGREAMRALLRGRLAHQVGIVHLFRALIRADCEICGTFGGYLFLPKAIRCCFACIERSPRMRVICLSRVANIADVPERRLRQRLAQSILVTVPGIYSIFRMNCHRRPKELVVEEAVVELWIAEGEPCSGALRALQGGLMRVYQHHMASTSLPWFDEENLRVEDGLCCKGCQLRAEEHDEKWEDTKRVFSRAGFLEHFQQCVGSQELWEKSNHGQLAVKEPKFTGVAGANREFDDGARFR